jgi:hypothetical protein
MKWPTCIHSRTQEPGVKCSRPAQLLTGCGRGPGHRDCKRPRSMEGGQLCRSRASGIEIGDDQ